jgi:hypothetical protein
MAARLNDPELRQQILRLKSAGLGIGRGARTLGISQTTWAWHVKHAPEEPYRVVNGERESVPPGRTLFACPVCGCKADRPEGHQHHAA